MTIAVIGTGFVGVVSAAVFASFDHTVYGLDIDEQKVASLKQGNVPFFEPHLETMLVEQQQNGNLHFTTDYAEAISNADLIIIAVGTPSAPDGQADLTYVLKASESLAPHLKNQAIVAVKSTVPPGTLEKVRAAIEPHTDVTFYTASLPEFLKEGSAVDDTLHPDRVVIGASDDFAFNLLERLHKPFNAPILTMSPESAQMAKYAANSYLATRITFANQIADLCEKNGADIEEVIRGIGLDTRIGHHYWYPGFGYGGSCFPKDVKELAAYSRAVGEENNLLNKINELNEGRIEKLMDTYSRAINGWDGKRVAILGLSFKPNTDDMREAPALKVSEYLANHGAEMTAYDPKALEVAQRTIPNERNVRYFDTIEGAVEDVDVIIALIEWPQIISHDFAAAGQEGRTQWFIDARNQFDPERVQEWGFTYLGIGRKLTN